MKVHPVHRRVRPSRAPASQNPVHRRGGYPFVAAQRKSLVALVSGIDRVRRLGSGFPSVQCAHAIRLPGPLVARTDAENIYLFWCLFCPVSLPDCFDPAVGLGHGLCRARTPGNPAGGSPVRCKETLPVGVVAPTAMTKKRMPKPKVTLSRSSFFGLWFLWP